MTENNIETDFMQNENKRKLIFLGSGDAISTSQVLKKYPNEFKRLEKYYEIYYIDYSIRETVREFIEMLPFLIPDYDIVVKDLTKTAYNPAGYIGKGEISLDSFPAKEKLDTFIMTGDAHNFKDLFNEIKAYYKNIQI